MNEEMLGQIESRIETVGRDAERICAAYWQEASAFNKTARPFAWTRLTPKVRVVAGRPHIQWSRIEYMNTGQTLKGSRLRRRYFDLPKGKGEGYNLNRLRGVANDWEKTVVDTYEGYFRKMRKEITYLMRLRRLVRDYIKKGIRYDEGE